MPNTSARKAVSEKEPTTPSAQSDENAAGGANTQLNTSGGSSSGKSKKKKQCEVYTFNDFESEFADCDLDDAVALELKLRNVAKRNSLSHEEMMKLLHKFVKNEHILALVTLKAENELAKEKEAAEQRTFIITDTPSVPKLTRAKARELKKAPIIPFPQQVETDQLEFAKLIDTILNSDEEDEEYSFKEEDFATDDEANATASDWESNPRTPQTPITQPALDESPIKLTDDGCFKLPLNLRTDTMEDLRIATRTRSKLCLQQTTIEDIQSEFVPPDIEELSEGPECEIQGVDEDWMQFLNDFTKPLSTTLVGDEDDPDNDPEYVAAEKVPVDAEELRDVNISKKELAELMSELLGELNEGISLESIELETPRKFLQGFQPNQTANSSPEKVEKTDDINPQLDGTVASSCRLDMGNQSLNESQHQSCVISSSNITQQDMSFRPDVMSTPSTSNNHHLQLANGNETMIPVAAINNMNGEMCLSGTTITIAAPNLNSDVEFIAVPVPGQPNQFQLAKIVNNGDTILTPKKTPVEPSSVENINKNDDRYSQSYETNFSRQYISVKRVAIAEYAEKFNETLKLAQVSQISSTTSDGDMVNDPGRGFSQYQYDLLQQQMRIHVQMLTQTYVQTYSHPVLWRLAAKPREMLTELKTKAAKNSNFRAWNLDPALELVENWTKELDELTEENTEFINFLHRETDILQNHARQIPKFHPRIMECYLNSSVFMYPEYLPRMPFTPRMITHESFSPVETFLIARGLEKHLNLIKENREKIPYKSSPLRVACKRLTKDILSGKHWRAVWNQIERMKKADYNNPIKYFFEHNKAPPVEVTPIIGFANNTVPKPIERPNELPLVFQKYLDEKNAPPKQKKYTKKYNADPPLKVSDKFKDSFLEVVREAVGEDIILLNNDDDPANLVATTPAQTYPCTPTKGAVKRKIPAEEPKAKRRVIPKNFTINVNYLFGGSSVTPPLVPPASGKPNVIHLSLPPIVDASGISFRATAISTEDSDIQDLTVDETAEAPSINDTIQNPASIVKSPVITYRFDPQSCTLQPSVSIQTTVNSPQLTTSATETHQQIDGFPRPALASISPIASNTVPLSNSNLNTVLSVPKLLTPDSPGFVVKNTSAEDINCTNSDSPKLKPKLPVSPTTTTITLYENNENAANEVECKEAISDWDAWRSVRSTKILGHIRKLNRNILRISNAHRQKRKIRQRCEELITAYASYLEALQLRYRHSPIVQNYYRKFLSLNLYSNLLVTLKRFCSKLASECKENISDSAEMSTSANSPSGLKRARNSNSEDENSPSSQRLARKINRQEENLRHMLLPDSAEEINRKDGIYAFNFYEKVEEAFRLANKPDDCKKFNAILKSFDPKCDKVSDLYYKLEKLFLPDHPDLAQVFLTFLLPSDAAAIGKFFEHFMICNMTTFINKLNIYFNKQPAQIRKIYNCLNELAEDPDVTIKKLETRILPLLKGNQFLIDWFMQQFPQSVPPERLLSNPEHIINLKDLQTKTGENVETLTDLLDSPTSDNQTQQICQLRYINGRIFYGSKLLLPAKLSFMATSLHERRVNTQSSSTLPRTSTCVHGIREHGDKLLQSASEMSSLVAPTEPTDEQERSEEDDVTKDLVIDTTAEEDESSSSFEPCDENTLKAHALRLNPSYYGSSYNSSNATSTPNIGSNFQAHHANAKKTSLNFNEPDVGANTTAAGKISPRKQLLNSPFSNTCSSNSSLREKRRSPSKKTRSPSNTTTPRSVRSINQPMVVLHASSSAIQCAKRLKCLVEEPSEDCRPLNDDNLDSSEHMDIANVKRECTDDLEFLSDTSSISRSPFPSLKMETDSNDEEAEVCSSEKCPDKPTTEPSTEITSPKVEDKVAPWTRDEDKIILIEMKMGSQIREQIHERIAEKLTQRSMAEIIERHQFLMDFLSKFQAK